MTAISFVVPVYNGERWLDEVVAAILREVEGRTAEVILVDDGSTDGSAGKLRSWAADPRISVIVGPGRGGAAAINAGLTAAHHPLIAQVDQDVILLPGWLDTLVAAHEAEPGLAAAQGRYVVDRKAPPLERAAAYDLELRTKTLEAGVTDHVCTGNSLYRASALAEIGGFDENLGYGYDNDLSYRLTHAGHSLLFCPAAHSVHRWRSRWAAFLRHQYGVGYGRLDVIAKNRHKVLGDRVSGPGMILRVPAMFGVILAFVATLGSAAADGAWKPPAAAGALLLAGLTVERLVAAFVALRRWRDPAALLLVPAHLLRDVIWVWALVRWCARRLLGSPNRPWHSMRRS